jgi:hypothetical protein
MRKIYANVKQIRVDTSIPQNAQLLWQNDKLALYYNYDSTQGRVDWIMQNNTNSSILVSLLRGAELNINNQTYTIPNYLFGNAFAEVYFANGLSTFITDLNNIPLYSLAIVKNKSNYRTIAFIFQIPSNSVIIAPEYGFNGLQSINGQLLEATATSENLYVIAYDFAEIIEYQLQTGINVNYPPDPYIIQSYEFEIDMIGDVVTSRLIFEIPEISVNSTKSLVRDIIKIIDKLKGIF